MAAPEVDEAVFSYGDKKVLIRKRKMFFVRKKILRSSPVSQ